MKKIALITTSILSMLVSSCSNPGKKPVTISSISLSAPYQTVFNVDDDFTYEGLKVTAHYSDRTSKVVTDYTVSTPDLSSVGEKNVVVTYSENNITKSSEYTVKVKGEYTPAVAYKDNMSVAEVTNYFNGNVLSVLNYSSHIHSQLADDPNPFAEFNIYSINDDAIFDDYDDYFYSGFIRQKGQGIVDFQMLKGGSLVIPGTFYATNPEISIHRLYSIAPANLLACDITRAVEEENNVFISTSFDGMAILANLGLGLYAQVVEAPEDYKITVKEDSITFNSTFILRYIDDVTGSYVEVNCDVDVIISSVGETEFLSVESYAYDPYYVYQNPTEWSNDDIAFIKARFNNQLPPFMDKLSYSYEIIQGVSSGVYCAQVMDYFSGDLSSIYGPVLVKHGYSKVNDYEYVKVIKNVESKKEEVYRVIMLFKDNDKEFYPNGVFQTKFVYTERPLEEIVSLKLLKEYLEAIDVAKFFKFNGLNEESVVAGFLDGTANANALVGEDLYKFVSTSSSKSFKIKFSYADAVKFIAAEKELLNSFEDLNYSQMPLLQTFMYSSDDGDTQFQFIDTTTSGESSYPGYIEMRIKISNAFYDAHNSK